MKIEPSGFRAYYAIGNFSQRIDLVEASTLASLHEKQAQNIAAALFAKIRRLWKARNYLIHSHYVYARFDSDGNYLGGLHGVGRELGEHPKERANVRRVASSGGVEFALPQTVSHGFAYERWKDGMVEYVPVNRGTFENHAAQLSKRLRQVRLFTKAVHRMDALLKWGSFSTSHGKLSPRAIRNQRRYQEIQESRTKLSSPPQS